MPVPPLDCDQFTGRKRDICRGHDDAGHPVLTPEKCEAYRRLWASQPQGESPSRTPVPPPPTYITFHDPCPHRGEKIGEEKCQLCGMRNKIAPVHACAVFGSCTPGKYKHGSAPHAVCLGCDKNTLDN